MIYGTITSKPVVYQKDDGTKQILIDINVEGSIQTYEDRVSAGRLGLGIYDIIAIGDRVSFMAQDSYSKYPSIEKVSIVS